MSRGSHQQGNAEDNHRGSSRSGHDWARTGGMRFVQQHNTGDDRDGGVDDRDAGQRRGEPSHPVGRPGQQQTE